MSSWRLDYSAALSRRDKLEKADLSLFDSYTRLADRTAALEAAKRQQQQQQPQQPQQQSSNPPSPRPPSSPPLRGSPSRKPSGIGTPPPPSPSNHELSLIPQLRRELLEAQKSRTELTARLTTVTSELESLRQSHAINTQRISELSKERTSLKTRVRDRDEELRGKAKLLENVQDELLSLNLQLNVAEDQSKALRVENKELVDRWMAHKGLEADAMNRASKFS